MRKQILETADKLGEAHWWFLMGIVASGMFVSNLLFFTGIVARPWAVSGAISSGLAFLILFMAFNIHYEIKISINQTGLF